MTSGRTFAIFSVKGGVGKTTTAVNLSYLAARGGDPTLLLDLDPQGAATYHMRIRPKIKGGARRLVAGDELDAQIRGSDYENLDVLPADFSYRNLDLALDASRKPRRRLARLLAKLRKRYRYVFIDCAPTLSLVSECVFEAADVVLVPTIPTPLSLQSLDLVVRQVRKSDRAPLIVPFFSMVDRRKQMHRNICDDADSRRIGFLETVAPYASLIEQMSMRRAPLPATAPRQEISRVYEDLWAETLARVDGPSRKVTKLVRRLLDSALKPARRATSTGAAKR